MVMGFLEYMMVVVVILLVLLLLLAARLLRVQKKIRKKVNLGEKLYEQTEALIKLHNVVQFKAPLPPMRVWAASPDVGVVLFNEIIDAKARTIVDFGSGVSTLISAYAIQAHAGENLGGAQIYSFDHESEFFGKTRRTLARHGVEDLVTLVHAPLKKQECDGEMFEFYDPAKLDEIDKVDVLFIDGPHGSKGILDRYPALPLVFDKLSDNAVVVVDDAQNFKESSELVSRWRKKHPSLKFEMLQTEVGTVVFRK
jgi:predicted O-methyltransferase YrrM